MKIIILIALPLIVGMLFLAGHAMVKDDKNSQPKSNRMVKALTWRIGLSVALFLLVWLSYLMGWLKPTGFAIGQ